MMSARKELSSRKAAARWWVSCWVKELSTSSKMNGVSLEVSCWR